VDPVDAQLLGGYGAEHHDRLASGAVVEPVAAGDAGAEHGQQFRLVARTCSPPGVADRDHRVPVDVLVLEQGAVRHLLDLVQEA